MYKEISKVDLNKYTMVSEYPTNRFEYNLNAIIQDKNFTYSRDDEVKFVLKKSELEPYIHFGEKVAYEIAKKLKFKCCRVELFKGVDDFGRKTVGDISYFDLDSDEEIINPYWALNWYRKNYEKQIYPASIDVIFDACKKYCFEKDNRPDEEFENFMRDFIYMTVFDLKFGNFDRKENNWLLRINKQNGKYDLYPMFDNEAILGFANDEPENLSDENIERFNEHFKSMVCTSEDGEKRKGSSMENMIKFLLMNYPIQTKEAIIRIFEFTKSDLEEILNNIPDLPESRRKFAIKNFECRDTKFRNAIKSFLEDEKIQHVQIANLFSEER